MPQINRGHKFGPIPNGYLSGLIKSSVVLIVSTCVFCMSASSYWKHFSGVKNKIEKFPNILFVAGKARQLMLVETNRSELGCGFRQENLLHEQANPLSQSAENGIAAGCGAFFAREWQKWNKWDLCIWFRKAKLFNWSPNFVKNVEANLYQGQRNVMFYDMGCNKTRAQL